METENQKPSSGCDICQEPWEESALTHLPIYVHGPGGVNVCPDCHQHFTDFLRALRSLASKGRRQGRRQGLRQGVAEEGKG